MYLNDRNDLEKQRLVFHLLETMITPKKETHKEEIHGWLSTTISLSERAIHNVPERVFGLLEGFTTAFTHNFSKFEDLIGP